MSTLLPQFPGLTNHHIHLRALTIDDVSATYLSWFSSAGAVYIAGGQAQTLDSLRAFVSEKLAKPDTLLLGIFDATDSTHIGNIKYEPVDLEAREAMLGIFVGATDRQGRGVGRDAIGMTADWLYQCCNLRQILLGVEASNTRARKTYEALGFVPAPLPCDPEEPNNLNMVLPLPRGQ